MRIHFDGMCLIFLLARSLHISIKGHPYILLAYVVGGWVYFLMTFSTMFLLTYGRVHTDPPFGLFIK